MQLKPISASGISLSSQITMLVFWSLVLMGIGLASYFLNDLEKNIEQERASIGDSIAYKISALSSGMLFSQTITEKDLQSIVGSRSNVAVAIYQQEQLLVAINHPLKVPETETMIRSLPSFNATDLRRVHVSFPSVAYQVKQQRKHILVVLGTALLLFGVLLRKLMERLIRQPVMALVASAKCILEGDCDKRFNESGSNELGYLAKFMNQALDNITQQEQEAQNAKEFAEVTLKSINDGVITTDRYGKITFVNPYVEKLIGLTFEEVKGVYLKDVVMLVKEDTRETIISPVGDCLLDNQTIDIDTNCALQRSNGSFLPIAVSVAPIQDINGKVRGTVMTLHDVSEAYELQRKLSYQASHDHLTGLYNRRELESELQRALLNAKRDKQVHALCYLDLDQFKVINDSCGHSAGDLFLRRISEYLKEDLRKSDVFARVGGDEFALLLLNCTQSEAQKVAANILKKIGSFRFSWQGRVFQVGVSVGLVSITEHTSSTAELLAQADVACFAAKDGGRNRVHMYQADDMELKRRRDEMSMVSYVREALAEDQFEIHLQPIVPTNGLQDRTHYEVLIRMMSSENLCVPPGVFLPAAERYQLMSSIDRWVVSKSLALMKHQREINASISLSINISAQSINEENFLEFVIAEMQANDMDGSDVCFEITESEAINNMQHAVHFIEQLQKLHCKFALDDFGTGVSSFEYLKNLPVDYLKIDGTFVKNIDKNKIDQAMVRAIHEVATVMGMQTIAEFVENEASFHMLGELGVGYAQGYWIARPKSAEEVLREYHGGCYEELPEDRSA